MAVRRAGAARRPRAGMLLSGTADDPGWQARVAAFVQGLQQSGWIDGRNLQLDIRWSAGIAADALKHAAELVALAPDVIVASGSSDRGHFVPSRKRDDQVAIDDRQWAPGHDQTAIRGACEGRDGALNLEGAGPADWNDFHPQRRRHRLDCSELADPGG